LPKRIQSNIVVLTLKGLDRPQYRRDWQANEWIYECFTCLHHRAYAPSKNKLLKQVKLHDKECLGGWA
jgi:hypothetical protein